jgi:cell division protein FtsQ
MRRIEANTPDTRARIAARRRSQRRSQPKQSRKAAPAKEKASHVRDRLQEQKAARRAPTQPEPQGMAYTRRQVRTALKAPSNALQRVRRQARMRMRHTQAGSQVRPGPQKILLSWVASGRLFSMVLFLVAVGFLVYLFISPHFHVQTMEVEGNSILHDETVASLSGLQGVPIWFVNNEQASTRVLQNAYVDHVSIDVSLPDHATIRISERRPETRWAIGGVQYLIDGSGRVLDVAQEPPDPDTLVIVDSTSSVLQPMDHVDTDAINVARALALRLPNELGFTPTTIGWDIGLGVYVTTEAGQTIVFGQSDNLDRKITLLKHLLADGTAFTYLDLRPSNPYYRTES